MEMEFTNLRRVEDGWKWMNALFACSVKTVSEVSKQIHTEGREKIFIHKSKLCLHLRLTRVGFYC